MVTKVFFRSMLVIIGLLLTLSFSSYGQKIKFEGLADVESQEILSQFSLNGQYILTQQTNQTQQDIHVSGWYYRKSNLGDTYKITVHLIVQKIVGYPHPQYDILSIDGHKQYPKPRASYDSSTGLYVFRKSMAYGSDVIYFNM